METKSILSDKSLTFAIYGAKCYKFLTEQHKEYVLSKQFLKSSTSIGANIREARNAESSMDFIHKLGIAQKETDETLYWLEVLYRAEYISSEQYESLSNDATELLKMIRSSIMTKKKNLA